MWCAHIDIPNRKNLLCICYLGALYTGYVHEATGLIVINPDTTDSVSTLSNSSPVNERKQKAKLFYNGASYWMKGWVSQQVGECRYVKE